VKIAITGGLGHIGSRLLRHLPLFYDRLDLTVIDNLSTQRFGSLFNLHSTSSLHFIEGDVTNIDLKELFVNIDVVIHLAAITDATSSFSNSERVEHNNFVSTERVARACIATGSRLVHLSSTSVYGSQENSVDESCPEKDLRPQSPYAITKLREERLVKELANNAGLRATTFRFGTIFGVSPGMRFHTAVNKFCWQASWGLPLTVWNTAFDQKRPYLDLDDACDAIIHLISNDLFDGNLFNVVSENVTVRTIVDEIRKHRNDLSINFVDSEIMNQLSYEVDDSKIKLTGYSPKGKLSTGIEQTMTLLGSAKS